MNRSKHKQKMAAAGLHAKELESLVLADESNDDNQLEDFDFEDAVLGKSIKA